MTRSLPLAIFCALGAGAVALGFFSAGARADSITTNDGNEIRGIVVEEYIDRFVVSTVDGEATVLKADIEKLTYDSEDANLIKLAEQALSRNDKARAYSLYEKALAVNPRSKPAQDGLAYLQDYTLRMLEMAKIDEIKKREAADRFGSVVEADASDAAKQKALLGKATGMTIRVMDDSPRVEKVNSNSPAFRAGVRAGDHLVAIWGKLTGYMSSDEILAALLNRSGLEIKCTIERTVEVPVAASAGMISGPEDLIGASLTMTRDGLAVTNVSAEGIGLQKGDRIMAINGNATRYMPLRSAIDQIKDNRGGRVKITFRRNVTIWRAG